MDKIITDIGYVLDGDDKLSYFAFADDIVLLADSKAGLEVNTKLVMPELQKAGFEANATKSATLGIVARGGKWLGGPQRQNGNRPGSVYL